MTDRELDALVAEKVFGVTGLGYYGPPTEGRFEHERSVRFATAAEANAAYAAYWDSEHAQDPRGYIGREDWDARLCHWREGHGPLSVPEYTEWIGDAWLVVEKMRELGFNFAMHDFDEDYIVSFAKRGGEECPTCKRSEYITHQAECTSAARGICLVALRALGVELPTAGEEG